jgi:hypothetical protein
MLIKKINDTYCASGTIDSIPVTGEGPTPAHALGMAVRSFETAVAETVIAEITFCQHCNGTGELEMGEHDNISTVKCECVSE